MSTIGKFRNALFGNPPTSDFKPSRSGVLDGLTDMQNQISGIVSGVLSYATVADLPSVTSDDDGDMARIFDDTTSSNNTYWVVRSGQWEIDIDFVNVLSTVVQPLVDDAETARDEAEEFANLGTETVTDFDEAKRLADDAGTDEYEVVTEENAANGVWGTSFGVARFFDAGSVNDTTQVKIGSVISAVFFDASVSGARTNKIRIQIHRRKLTSPDLNSAPGATDDDVLIYDSGVADMPDQIPEADTGTSTTTYRPFIPVTPFKVIEGYTYGVSFHVEDAGGVKLGMRMGRKQLVSATVQRFAGFNYSTFDAVSYSNYGTARAIAFGLGKQTVQNINSIKEKTDKLPPVASTPSLLTPMELRMIENRGEWWNERLRPTWPTYRDGLARLKGMKAGAIFGVDFGHRVDEDQLIDLTTTGQFSSDKLNLNGTEINTPDGYLIENGKLLGKTIDISSNMKQQIVLRDLLIDGDDYSLPNGIVQQDGSQFVIVEYVHLKFIQITTIDLTNGIIRNCVSHSTGQNCINVGSDQGFDSMVQVEQSLFLLPGLVASGLPDPHGDAIECNRTDNFSACANSIYMVAADSIFDPPIGDVNKRDAQVNCIRHSTSAAGHQINNSYALGNAMWGCNPAQTIRNRYDGCEVKNVLRAFNRFSGHDTENEFGGGGYESAIGGLAGQLQLRATTAGNVVWKNVAIFDEFLHDGSPAAVYGSAVPASYFARPADTYRIGNERCGVFDYDKNEPDLGTPKLIEALHRLGKSTGRDILTTNNDLNPKYDLGNLITTPEV